MPPKIQEILSENDDDLVTSFNTKSDEY
ncbi:unnamed protein product, partial [Adineta steineri]